MSELVIRDAVAGDRAAWQGLWRQYCAFYRVAIADDVTAATWRRILDPAAPFGCLMAVNGDVVGFAVYILHPNSWSAQQVCYLEDLYVERAARGRGAGRALIEALVARGRSAGWFRVYWVTDADNHTAQALYDRVAWRTDKIRYDIDLGAAPAVLAGKRGAGPDHGP